MDLHDVCIAGCRKEGTASHRICNASKAPSSNFLVAGMYSYIMISLFRCSHMLYSVGLEHAATWATVLTLYQPMTHRCVMTFLNSP